MATNKSNFNLPLDVMKKILLLLSIESIPSCKLVSKEWKNLIDDPEFFKRFRDTSLSFFDLKDKVYCVLTREGNTQINGGFVPPFTVNRILKGAYFTELLSESSKGIVCVITSVTRNLLFYNMLTGASEAITYAPLKKEFREWLCYGFGYDCYANDCKIMLVCYNGSEDGHEWMYGKLLDGKENSLIQVYSLRNRAWKSFNGFPYAAYGWSKFGQSQACALNGALHWLVRTRTGEKNVIVTYDLHTCRFGEMEMPDACDGGYPGPRVVELGGQLCCWNRNSTINVWAMKEYGVSKSWVMLLSIGNNTMLTHSTFFSEFVNPTMLYECRDGRIVVFFASYYYGSLYWYNINNHKLELVMKGDW